ncbi:MAG: thioredoxin domain-containing protein [Thermodesulfobacteriota bacterium]|nr:thioredoxin domain-containing protein [Thermodesulfobacteriota bacterium]
MTNTTKHSPNRLIHESSPYLRQHADNLVDWYPWSDEAIETARRDDKPLLLSIGYSTCHWCHVMADESFSDPDAAAIMNRHFVCVKVDREERPDIDTLYITAVSAMTGSAGWPLHVFLDPETLQPFFGGTYFPPQSRLGMASWSELLKKIAAAWNNPGERARLGETTDAVAEYLNKRLGAEPVSGTPGQSTGQSPDQPLGKLLGKLLDRAMAAFSQIYDPDRGGFGNVPKFPMPSILHFLIALAAENRPQSENARNMAVHTLNAMAAGGIYDQLGGGFHRYSTDGNWHLPHFEKMLYDNGQLLAVLADAYLLTKDTALLRVAEQTADYILRDMTHPEGGFYSAEDADSPLPEDPSEHAEGAFYVWTEAGVKGLLSPPAARLVTSRFGVRPEGNVANDPHGEFDGKNVLFQARTVADTAAAVGIRPDEADGLLDAAIKDLMAHRQTRPRPHLDDKIITAWNGLMISGLSRVARVSGDSRYHAAAEKAAGFVGNNLMGGSEGRATGLNRIWRAGESRIPGFAEDYAFFIKGLLDLYEIRFDPQWRDMAVSLAEEMLGLFFEPATGAVYQTREGHDPHIRLRVRETADNVLPAAGSIMADNLARLYRLTGQPAFLNAAEKILQAAVPLLAQQPSLAPALLTAAMGMEKERE